MLHTSESGWVGPPLFEVEGSGAVALAAATGAWTHVISANPRRRFCTITVPNDEADSLLVSLSRRADAVGSGAIFLLSPGQTLILSKYGDLPWAGSVYVQGYGAASSYFWGEIEEFS